MKTIIRQADLVESVAAALQYISYYHPPDFIAHLSAAYEREESSSAKDAIAQILTSSRMSATGMRPICQDTGIVNVFFKIGMEVQFEGFDKGLQAAVDEGVRTAYQFAGNPLRASVVADAQFDRINTGDNTPAVVSVQMVAGSEVQITVAAKGFGSESKARFAVLNPSDSVVDWILQVVPSMGAGWCPPGVIGIGIGGTAEKALLMAKESLMDDLDMHQLQMLHEKNEPLAPVAQLRLEIFEKVNALGIGAQGLGGLTTVLDVKIRTAATHAAGKPIALIPNCAATRHATLTLDGSGPVYLDPPALDSWPEIGWMPDYLKSRRVNLNTLTRADVADWKAGDTLLLTGRLLTGRDAAHQRIKEMLEQGEDLPVNFSGRAIYYVGPVTAVGEEAVGPAGPTTATRMDKYTDMMLGDTGLLLMIGKAERGEATVDSIRKHRSAYLMAVGGAAYLVSKAIKTARVVAFEDLGMEAIYEFEVVDMPVTVAVDSAGSAIHTTGQILWRDRIAKRTFKDSGMSAALTQRPQDLPA